MGQESGIVGWMMYDVLHCGPDPLQLASRFLQFTRDETACGKRFLWQLAQLYPTRKHTDKCMSINKHSLGA